MKLKASMIKHTKTVAALLALALLPAGALAQTEVDLGLKLGFSYWTELDDICSDAGIECTTTAIVAGPRLRFGMSGPHGVELQVRTTATPYDMGSAAFAEINATSWSISYDARPAAQDISFRIGYQSTNYNISGLIARYVDPTLLGGRENGPVAGVGVRFGKNAGLEGEVALIEGEPVLSMVVVYDFF